MATSVTTTAIVPTLRAAEREFSVTGLYQLRKSFAAVQFDTAGKGRIVFLPKGAELRVAGPSRLCGCLEVLCKNRSYSVFEVDLLGPRSVSIEPNHTGSARIETGRAIVAAGAN